MVTTDLHATYEASALRKALDTIERHRVNLEHEGIEVPGICVAGAQSAGKSSVLESISGIAFPRAENMCTRCPAVVSLERDDSAEEPSVVLATDASYEMERVECKLPEVGGHIQKLTDSLSANGTVTHEWIFIRVTMANCPTLTLTDLPGITSLSPNQADIEEATVALTESFMANKATIMLVVIPGHEDFNNPKALKLAFKHDPDGARTIGVVTKVDQLPANSDIVEKVCMKRDGDVRVEQGIIAVRNRAKDEMDLSADDVREKERNLFKTDPKLRQLSPSQWGIGTLTQKIVDLQTSVVAQFLPAIKATLRKKIVAVQAELDGLEKTCVTAEERRNKFTSVVCQLSRELDDTVSGRLYSVGQQDKSLNIPARSSELFEKFAKSVSTELPNFLSDEFTSELEETIKETRGVDLANFMSGPVFKAVVTGAFDAPLATHSETLTHETHVLIHGVITQFVEKLSSGLPNLPGYIIEVVDALLEDRMSRVSSTLDILLKAEQRHVFTQNHYYMNTLTKFRSAAASGTSDTFLPGMSADFLTRATHELRQGSSNAQQGVREMQVSLYAYSKVLQKRVFDIVPMVVRDALVADVCANLTRTLMSHAANNASQLEFAMSQDPGTVRLRERKTRTLNSLKNALTDFTTLRC